MKIAFWSNVSEACGVSSSLAAISIASVIRYPYTVVTMENRLCSNNLGKAYMGRLQSRSKGYAGNSFEAGTNYYEGGGLEGLIRKIYRDEYNLKTFRRYLSEVIHKHLYYIPQTKVIHNEIFDYEFDQCYPQLQQLIEEFADICMIDTASYRSLSTKTILENADLIVVNLCQKHIILEDFFLNYSSLIPKAIFIINKYDPRMFPNYRRILKEYDISPEKLTVIPYNEMYQSAYAEGTVVEFISRNYNCPKENANYLFIQSIKKAAYMIIKEAEQLVKQKEQQFMRQNELQNIIQRELQHGEQRELQIC